MNKKILREFAKNGLEILQWSILLLLSKAEKQTLTVEKIQKDLNLPKASKNSKPQTRYDNAFTREILRSSQEKDGYVKYVEGERATWQLTDKGKKFVESGLGS